MRKNLQLVGVAAMLLASKYEEIWAPEVHDFVYISDKAYTKEQVLDMVSNASKIARKLSVLVDANSPVLTIEHFSLFTTVTLKLSFFFQAFTQQIRGKRD